MKSKVCLVTGATDGIGLITAGELARQGATVVLVGRNPAKTEKVTAEIRQETGNDRVSFLLADLSIQADIHQLATSFQQKFDRLDVLINNAGAFFNQRQQSVDGIELTWALNHLNYYLLSLLLLDSLLASAPARIVNVSSDAHQGADIDLDDVEYQKRKYSGFSAYSQSKLANILFTQALAEKIEGTGVTANALHPGFVRTRFASNNGVLISLIMKPLMWLMAIPPEKGAETSLYLATSAEVEGVNGRYFSNKKETTPKIPPNVADMRQRLWQLSAKQTNMEQHKHV